MIKEEFFNRYLTMKYIKDLKMSPIKYFNEHDNGPSSHPAPAGESLLVRQRLRNLWQ